MKIIAKLNGYVKPNVRVNLEGWALTNQSYINCLSYLRAVQLVGCRPHVACKVLHCSPQGLQEQVESQVPLSPASFSLPHLAGQCSAAHTTQGACSHGPLRGEVQVENLE